MNNNAARPRLYAFFRRCTAVCFSVCAMACLLLLPAHATPLTRAEENSIRAVVEGQMAALAIDDAVKAFSFAAPNVRKIVGTAPQFMRLVRSSFPAIYRPTSAAFLKPEDHHGQVMQRVQVVDASGDAWLATYSMQRQKDKSWRITGCSVVANNGRMA